jgi:hypothetical protein
MLRMVDSLNIPSVWVYVYECMSVCVWVYECMCMSVWVYVYECMSVCYKCIYECMSVWVYVYECMYTPTHIHTYLPVRARRSCVCIGVPFCASSPGRWVLWVLIWVLYGFYYGFYMCFMGFNLPRARCSSGPRTSRAPPRPPRRCVSYV